MKKPVYLDCNATTPLEPEVAETLIHYLTEEYGNEGSRTHEYGSRAKQAVQQARDQVASVVAAQRDEVFFTSGATESNNLAILGLVESGEKSDKRHIVCTQIEHKAVLEPMDWMQAKGFDITWVDVGPSGRLEADAIQKALRKDTHLVSVMHANNETGVIQPIDQIAEVLQEHSAYFHTDAAQTFGKELSALRNKRIDLISISGHKIFGPKGIGALIARRRGYRKCPLAPIYAGGGQERGLRPGTLPVALIAALGKAAEMAEKNHAKRTERCLEIRTKAMNVLNKLAPKYSGDQTNVMPHVINLSINQTDSEALIVGLKDLIAISNGSACTSASYSPSHVLKAMGMNDDEANACIRISWSHLTPDVDWDEVAGRIKKLI